MSEALRAAAQKRRNARKKMLDVGIFFFVQPPAAADTLSSLRTVEKDAGTQKETSRGHWL